jgi:hypothetical protein
MSQDYVELEIRGMKPRTFGNGNSEESWRRYIADYVAQKKDEGKIPESHLNADSSTRFEISLVFYLLEDKLKAKNGNDIDNLAKPVLDTIFFSPPKGRTPKRVFPTGALYRIDDSAVWKLYLEKRVAGSPEKAGVSMRITIL